MVLMLLECVEYCTLTQEQAWNRMGVKISRQTMAKLKATFPNLQIVIATYNQKKQFRFFGTAFLGYF